MRRGIRTARYTRYGNRNSCTDSRPEIYFPHNLSENRGRRGYASVVWRTGWQALRDDPQRYGQDEAHSSPPAGSRGAMHDTWQGNGSGGRCDSARPAVGRTSAGTGDNQSEVSDGPAAADLEENGHVHRDQLSLMQHFTVSNVQSFKKRMLLLCDFSLFKVDIYGEVAQIGKCLKWGRIC
jgi:hypothetical protein